ncbi:MAG: preprotein translocase subunit YajC [Gemmataceae bacterium]
MLIAALLWAQDAAPKGESPATPFNPMFLMIALFAMFYFIVIRPQQRKEKEHRRMLENNLKKNDEVVTNAGIIGIVHSIKEGSDEVVLKLEDNAKMRILRSSINRINSKESEKTDAIQVAKTDAK